MVRDVAEAVEPYLDEDRTGWAKLASTVAWRRLQLLLLREILLELRKLNRAHTGREQRKPESTEH